MAARALTAAIVALIGTAVFVALGQLLMGLMGSPIESACCALGAFASTWAFARPGETALRKQWLPAALIAVSTFVFISIGHALEQVLVRKVPVDFEPIGMFLWAIAGTSWWLVPMTALVLFACSRIVKPMSQ